MFWDSRHTDNALSINTSLSGFQFVQVACYVQSTPGPSLAPLWLLYNPDRHDHMVVATAAGLNDARAQVLSCEVGSCVNA